MRMGYSSFGLILLNSPDKTLFKVLLFKLDAGFIVEKGTLTVVV